MHLRTLNKTPPPPRQERGVWPPGGVLCPARLSPATGVFEAGCPAVHGRLRQGEGRPMESSRSYTGTWRCLVGPCWCLHCPPPPGPPALFPTPMGACCHPSRLRGLFVAVLLAPPSSPAPLWSFGSCYSPTPTLPPCRMSSCSQAGDGRTT